MKRLAQVLPPKLMTTTAAIAALILLTVSTPKPTDAAPSASVVVLTVDSPETDYSTGLAWDGAALWVSGAFDGMIYRFDPYTSTTLASLNGPTTKLRDLEWDGQFLWVASWESPRALYKLDPLDGSVVASFPPPFEGHPHGLAWDGSSLWIGEEDGNIYKVDPTTGTAVLTLSVSSECCGDPRGLAWDGQNLWAGFQRTGVIRSYDVATGAVISETASPSSGFQQGVAWDGQALWTTGSDNKIYKLGNAESTATPTPAATPSPSPSPTPTPTPSATPTPTPLATPVVSSFAGHVCLDANCSGAAAGLPTGEVVAMIDGVECGRSTVMLLIDGPAETDYGIDVVSESDRPGCGREGATVQFYIKGRLAKQSGIWRAGARQHLDIWAGEDFAAFSGRLFLNGQPWPWPPPTQAPYVDVGDPLGRETVVVRASVQSTLCGEKAVEGLTFTARYDLLVVQPTTLRAGCGQGGDAITFTINGLPADQTPIWTPGFHELDLNVSVRLPNTGGPPGASHAAAWPLLAGGGLTLAALAGGALFWRRQRNAPQTPS